MGCGCSEGAGSFPMMGGSSKSKKSPAKKCPKCMAKAKAVKGTTLSAKDIKTLETCMARIKSVIEKASTPK